LTWIIDDDILIVRNSKEGRPDSSTGKERREGNV